MNIHNEFKGHTLHRRTALTSALALFIGACDRSKPNLSCLLQAPPEGGKMVVNRRVHVLIDQSPSVKEDYDIIRSVVKERIIDRAGVGDSIYAHLLAVEAGAGSKEATLLDPGEDPPRVRENIARGTITTEVLTSDCDSTRRLREELSSAWERFDAMRSNWVGKIDSRWPKAINKSPYLASLAHLGNRFAEGGSALSRWLFVVGDLREEGEHRSDVAKQVEQISREAIRLRTIRTDFFGEVKVRLMRKAVGEGDGGEPLEAAWRDYFRRL